MQLKSKAVYWNLFTFQSFWNEKNCHNVSVCLFSCYWNTGKVRYLGRNMMIELMWRTKPTFFTLDLLRQNKNDVCSPFEKIVWKPWPLNLMRKSKADRKESTINSLYKTYTSYHYKSTEALTRLKEACTHPTHYTLQ